MILPIVAYGDPMLRKKTTEIAPAFENLTELIESMFETMYNASGIGLAAPQIGKSIRLFVVDTVQLNEEDEEQTPEYDEAISPELKQSTTGIKQVFINPQIISETGKNWTYEEGCLSIPHVRENVTRPAIVHIQYLNQHFEPQTQTFDGLNARVIQHEYDHLEGVLFTDKISAFKRQLITKKLLKIAKGEVYTKYKMAFFNPTRKR